MARFRGTVQGARGEASRLGTVKTGLTVAANGWDIGGEVGARVCAAGDAIEFTLTAGSGRARRARTFARFVEGDPTPRLLPDFLTWEPCAKGADPRAVLRADFLFGEAVMSAYAYDPTTREGLDCIGAAFGGMGRQTTEINGRPYVVTFNPKLK